MFLSQSIVGRSLHLGLAIAVAACCTITAAHADVHTIGGKVVNVSHEKITLPNKTVADKVSVTIDPCDAPGTLKTLTYNPSTVSDRHTLGFLYEANLNQARSPFMTKPQPQVNGFGLFWVDANNHISRSGFLGHNVGCGQVNQLTGQF